MRVPAAVRHSVAAAAVLLAATGSEATAEVERVATPAAAAPKLLVRADDVVEAVADTASEVAWIERGSDACSTYGGPAVHVLHLRTGKRFGLPRRGCVGLTDRGPPSVKDVVAVAGGRVLWVALHYSHQEDVGHIVTASVVDPRMKSLCQFAAFGGATVEPSPTYLLAADNQTLMFVMSGDPPEGGQVCDTLTFLETRGRIVGPVELRGAARAIAARGGRVAVGVGRGTQRATGEPERVAMIDIATRTVSGTITFPSWVRGVALNNRIGAALIGQRVREIIWFDARTHLRLARVTLRSTNAASRIGIGADGSVIYTVGRDIHRLSLRMKRDRIIARSRSAPVGLSVRGRRILWGDGRRIVSVTLPK